MKYKNTFQSTSVVRYQEKIEREKNKHNISLTLNVDRIEAYPYIQKDTDKHI